MVDRELCLRQMTVSIVLATVGVSVQGVADDAGGLLHLGVGRR